VLHQIRLVVRAETVLRWHRDLIAAHHAHITRPKRAVRNLAMDLKDDGRGAGFLIRDRDSKYPPLFDAILADTGITVVLAGVRMPRMSATPHHYRTDTRWMPSVTWCGRA
jgi:hypothetical protein